jgi:hypothetical protein
MKHNTSDTFKYDITTGLKETRGKDVDLIQVAYDRFHGGLLWTR